MSYSRLAATATADPIHVNQQAATPREAPDSAAAKTSGPNYFTLIGLNTMTDDDKTTKHEDLAAKKAQELQERFEASKNEFMSKKVKEIPCFRSTFLTSKNSLIGGTLKGSRVNVCSFWSVGIPAGLVTSLVSYLATSKAKMSANIGMGTYLAVSAGYFFVCRRDYDQKIAQNKELGDLMNLIIKYRGTELEQQLQQRYKEKCEEFSK